MLVTEDHIGSAAVSREIVVMLSEVIQVPAPQRSAPVEGIPDSHHVSRISHVRLPNFHLPVDGSNKSQQVRWISKLKHAHFVITIACLLRIERMRVRWLSSP